MLCPGHFLEVGEFYPSAEMRSVYILLTGLGSFRIISTKGNTNKSGGGGPRGVMVKAMDCGIVESEFELQSRYYVHIRANTLGKGMNPLILPAMG